MGFNFSPRLAVGKERGCQQGDDGGCVGEVVGPCGPNIYRVSQNSVDFSFKWLLCTNKQDGLNLKLFFFSELFTYIDINQIYVEPVEVEKI